MRYFIIDFGITLFLMFLAFQMGKGFAVIHMYEQCVESNEVQMSPMFGDVYQFSDCKSTVLRLRS